MPRKQEEWLDLETQGSSWWGQLWGMSESTPPSSDDETSLPQKSHRGSVALTVTSSEEDEYSERLEYAVEQLEEQVAPASNNKSRFSCCPASLSRKKRLALASAVLLTIVLISVLCGTLVPQKKATSQASSVTTTDTPTTKNNDDVENTPTDNIPTAPTAPVDVSTFDFTPHAPFSTLDPVQDLQLMGVWHSRNPPTMNDDVSVPTNAWFQNLLMVGENEEPTDVNKAYAVPYLVDAAGSIPGLRVHYNHVGATSTVVQLHTIETQGLVLGATSSSAPAETTLLASATASTETALSKAYSVESTNPLGLTLKWNTLGMTSTIVRGMPYATMHYPKLALAGNVVPAISSQTPLHEPPLVDESTPVECNGQEFWVSSELKATFTSDFTWMVFVSEPVTMVCVQEGDNVNFQVVTTPQRNEETELTIRVALLSTCTHGTNAIHCQNDATGISESFQTLLRERAHLYPGPNAQVLHSVEDSTGVLRLDWNVQSMTSTSPNEELLMYALPHHSSRMEQEYWPSEQRHCTPSLIGSTCVVSGSQWNLVEEMPILGWRTLRPPRPETLEKIATALSRDIVYVIPDNIMRGAADTYFSGKILARVARVLMIYEELQDVCVYQNFDGYSEEVTDKEQYVEACRDLTLPTEQEFQESFQQLKQAVEVWINGSAEAQFAYDYAWGGVINCGCLWDGATQSCSNALAGDCPATTNQGLNFGNGFYNDHHFHYGYHIYAAAAVTHFDKEWGRDHFEDALLLVRDIANPSTDDIYFPLYRNKDWYQGSSWASGITMPTFTNGMNQESSSEAIAAYESVALFGTEMALAWAEVNDEQKVETSTNIRETGMIMAATEIRSTDYYWHVRRNDDPRQIYPSTYQEKVVGILWQNMAQFTTWFGSSAFLIYGIQLLPLTPISENRDAIDWLKEMYQPLADSCMADSLCEREGWSVLQLAILASIGHADTAMEKAQLLPSSAFATAGGNGHSMTNTLWYMATRPQVQVDLPIDDTPWSIPTQQQEEDGADENLFHHIDCGVPEYCTNDVLDSFADGYTCRERIAWLMEIKQYEQGAACTQVAVTEYPAICGQCGGANVR